jgi:hypothetical protein
MWTIAGSTAEEIAATLVRNAKKSMTARPAFKSRLKSIISSYLPVSRPSDPVSGSNAFPNLESAPDLMMPVYGNRSVA